VKTVSIRRSALRITVCFSRPRKNSCNRMYLKILRDFAKNVVNNAGY